VKILVIQTSRFGDLLQTTPMLHALRRRYPDASITVLSRYNVLEIYKDNPDIDYIELFNIEEYTNRLLNNPGDTYRSYTELRDAVNRLKSMKFDLLVNTTHDRFSTFLSYLIGSSEIKGMYLSPNKRLKIHIDGFWFRYLRCTSEFRQIAPFNLSDIYKNAIGGDQDTRKLFFNLEPKNELEAQNILIESPDTKICYIGFQLGTSTGNRRWPLQYFAKLGDMLQEQKGNRVVLLGSKDEKNLGKEITIQMKNAPINLIGKTNISLLAAILKRLSLLVTNDTGTMHLAEAVDTKCVSLFFESANPFQTGPYGSEHIICSPDLECFPCSTTFQCDDKKCLNVIPSEIVCQLVNYKLGKVDAQQIQIPEGMQAHETRFDRLGVWDVWPFNKISLNKNELARRLYRRMWIKYSEETEDIHLEKKEDDLQSAQVEELKPWYQCYKTEVSYLQGWFEEFRASLNLIERKTDNGISLIDDIISESVNVPFDRNAVIMKSEDLERIDKEIIQLGESTLMLRQMSSLFKLELEQIEDTNFFIMLNQWKQTYERLKHWECLLREDINLMSEILN